MMIMMLMIIDHNDFNHNWIGESLLGVYSICRFKKEWFIDLTHK